MAGNCPRRYRPVGHASQPRRRGRVFAGLQRHAARRLEWRDSGRRGAGRTGVWRSALRRSDDPAQALLRVLDRPRSHRRPATPTRRGRQATSPRRPSLAREVGDQWMTEPRSSVGRPTSWRSPASRPALPHGTAAEEGARSSPTRSEIGSSLAVVPILGTRARVRAAAGRSRSRQLGRFRGVGRPKRPQSTTPTWFTRVSRCCHLEAETLAYQGQGRRRREPPPRRRSR